MVVTAEILLNTTLNKLLEMPVRMIITNTVAGSALDVASMSTYG